MVVPYLKSNVAFTAEKPILYEVTVKRIT